MQPKLVDKDGDFLLRRVKNIGLKPFDAIEKSKEELQAAKDSFYAKKQNSAYLPGKLCFITNRRIKDLKVIKESHFRRY